MNDGDARRTLRIEAATVTPEEVRKAYLARAPTVRLDSDLDDFVRLRKAYETLARVTTAHFGSSDQLLRSAREDLSRRPDDAAARWNLLSLLPYAFDAEAKVALQEGARRDPDGFLDELLFHFPNDVPPDLLDRASQSSATFGRMALVARVHAEQGRPPAAARALAVAVALVGQPGTPLRSPAALRLVLAVVLALEAHAQDDTASTALGLITQKMAPRAVLDAAPDYETETVLQIATELDRLRGALPLDLRQAAARAAQSGDFANAPYAARFAVRDLGRRAARQLAARLGRDAPALAKVLALDLPEERLRPRGTPNFRVAIGVGSLIPAIVFSVAVYRRFTRPEVDVDKLLREVNEEMIKKVVGSDPCANPNSDLCRLLMAQVADGGVADGVADSHGDEAPTRDRGLATTNDGAGGGRGPRRRVHASRHTDAP